MFEVSRSYHSMARQIFKFSCMLPSSMTFLTRAAPLQDHAQTASKFLLNSEMFQFQSKSGSLLLSTNFSSFGSNKDFSKNLLPCLQKKNLQCFLGSAPLRFSQDLGKLFLGLRTVVGSRALCLTFIPNMNASVRTLGSIIFQVDFLDGKKSSRELYHKSLLPISKQLNQILDRSCPLDPSSVATEAKQPNRSKKEGVEQGQASRQQKLEQIEANAESALKRCDSGLVAVSEGLKEVWEARRLITSANEQATRIRESNEERHSKGTHKLNSDQAVYDKCSESKKHVEASINILKKRMTTLNDIIHDLFISVGTTEKNVWESYNQFKEIIGNTEKQIDNLKNLLRKNRKKDSSNTFLFSRAIGIFKYYSEDFPYSKLNVIKNGLQKIKTDLDDAAKILNGKKDPSQSFNRIENIVKFISLLGKGSANWSDMFSQIENLLQNEIECKLEQFKVTSENRCNAIEKEMVQLIENSPCPSEAWGSEGLQKILNEPPYLRTPKRRA